MEGVEQTAVRLERRETEARPLVKDLRTAQIVALLMAALVLTALAWLVNTLATMTAAPAL